MYVCQNCQQPINSASAICPYCGASQAEAGAGAAPKPARKHGARKLAIAFAVVVAGIWAIIWFALPLRFENPRPVAERSALEAVRALQQQLAAYANGAGAFPESLEALGEPARDAAQTAMTGGYGIRYAAGQTDASGKAHAYTLVCVPRNYGYESLYTDQSGVIRETRENRAATAQDAPVK